jgi:glycosyltransferase involved in cell wall biosynthesis
VTHLVGLLRAANPPAHGFEKTVVWASRATLTKIEDRPWLVKQSEPVLESHSLRRVWWQRYRLAQLARAEGCDLLFVPGGSFATDFRPVVTMSRNLLPFEWRELRRYSLSWVTLRLLVLRRLQTCSFQKADGVIFLTRYARDAILKVTRQLRGRTIIIPHGIDQRFFQRPRAQRPLADYSIERPFRLIYVSIVDVYKHQWHVAEAVANLKAEGLPVSLDLVGPAYPPALWRLKRVLQRVDPKGNITRYVGAVPFEELHAFCAIADLYLFASSCENLPNILLEGMASSLPIACSNRGPMCEILDDAGVYFDPEDLASIAMAIKELVQNPQLRTEKAWMAYRRAQHYSWQQCAEKTFAFLAGIVPKQDQISGVVT